jgi:two-component system, NarL family, nitrate/nitrite response regulator NarL
MSEDKIHILLIEDNRLLQEGITAMLDNNNNFDIVARYEGGEAVRELKSRKLDPDVVLLNLGNQKSRSLTLMALLKQQMPAARIVAMDILPDHVNILEFVQAGGHALILKNAPATDWVSTLTAVARGENVLPVSLTESLFSQIMADSQASATSHTEDVAQLTPREREIVDLIADGLSNRDIAETLHIATYTVKSHVHNILEKLTLNTRLQIAAYIRNIKSSAL